MKFETPELERGYGHIIEGACPICSQPMERLRLAGWCNNCGAGFSIKDETIFRYCERWAAE
jgi:hypothetical protein